MNKRGGSPPNSFCAFCCRQGLDALQRSNVTAIQTVSPRHGRLSLAESTSQSSHLSTPKARGTTTTLAKRSAWGSLAPHNQTAWGITSTPANLTWGITSTPQSSRATVGRPPTPPHRPPYGNEQQRALSCTTRCAGRGRPCHMASRGQQTGPIKRYRWILPLAPFTMVKATGKW